MGAEKENSSFESLNYRQIIRFFSDNNQEGTENIHDDIIDFFIDQFCIKQLNQKVSLKDLLNKIEKLILIEVLTRFNGCQKHASEFLRIKNTTLNEKIKRHKIRFVKILR